MAKSVVKNATKETIEDLPEDIFDRLMETATQPEVFDLEKNSMRVWHHLFMTLT